MSRAPRWKARTAVLAGVLFAMAAASAPAWAASAIAFDKSTGIFAFNVSPDLNQAKQEADRLCQAAGAKRLAIFHHDPDHDDDFMDALGEEAKAVWSETVVAREMMTLDVG